MDFVEIAFIAFGLAMDAFAVAMAATGTGKIDNKRAVFRLSFHFGLFQFMMPVIGWFAGTRIEPFISAFDYWIAFVLLQYVAIHMIISSQKSSEMKQTIDPSKGLNLVVLSVATSIDALAVGISLAMIDINIWYPSVIIGLITASLALLGITIGNYGNQKLGKMSAIIGGIILSLMGFRLLFAQI